MRIYVIDNVRLCRHIADIKIDYHLIYRSEPGSEGVHCDISGDRR